MIRVIFQSEGAGLFKFRPLGKCVKSHLPEEA